MLASLYDVVLLPGAVRRELYRRRATKDRVKRLLEEYEFLQACDKYDSASVAILLTERIGVRDRGEAETVVQASEFTASVLIDDQWGRQLASGLDLEVSGTMGLLNSFRELELISGSELRTAFAALKKRGIRLPWKAVDGILKEWGEEELPH